MTVKVQVNLADEPEGLMWWWLRDAIVRGWINTDRQMKELEYEEEIQHDSFGQFLFANVHHNVYQLRGLQLGMTVEMRLNRRKTAHHAIVKIGHKKVTVSAVPDQHSWPRYADFRNDCATRQLAFTYDLDSNTFGLQAPPSFESLLEGRETKYYQILHGPNPEDRQKLGFVQVVGVNIYGEHIAPPVDIDEYIGSIPQVRPNEPVEAHPTVDITDDIQVLPKEDIECPEKPEVRDSQGAD